MTLSGTALEERYRSRKLTEDYMMKLLVFILVASCLASGSYCQDCKVTKMGKEYRGTVNVTLSGLACQRWDSNYPHRHSNKKANRPNAGLDLNYCRNPDSESKGPWCYTVSRSRRYEFCNIPFCSEVQKCKRKIDVILLFEIEDGNPNAISYARDFFQSLKQTINPSLKCIRLEFILIGKNIEIMTRLDCEYDSDECYSSALRRLTSKRNVGSTKNANTKVLLLEAIARGQQHLFSEKHGARADAAKVVLLVLSNPPAKGPVPTQDAVKDLQDMGVKIVTVGAGDGKEENLFKISLNPQNTLKVEMSSDLSKENIVKKVASLLKGGANTNLPSRYQLDFALQSLHRQLNMPRNFILLKDSTQRCPNLVDIGFLVDASGSLKNDYISEKFFVQRIVAKFGISEAGSRAGVVVFSSRNYVETAIQFNRYSNFKDFKEGVDQLPFHGFMTRIDLALKAADKELFTKEAGSRENAAKILFLITDGRQNPDYESGAKLSPSAEAAKLHKRGIKIFSIGVGKRVNETELHMIARARDRVFMVDDFEQLTSDAFVKRVSKKSCDEAFIPRPTTNAPAVGEIKQNKTIALKTEDSKKENEKCNDNKEKESTASTKGKCCCNNRKPPVYVNVFNQEKNHNNLLQQSKIAQSGHSNSIDNIGFDMIDSRVKSRKMSTKEILDILKKLAPKGIEPPVKEKVDESNQIS